MMTSEVKHLDVTGENLNVTTYQTRAHHGWDTQTWRDVSSYLFTYLPRNYDTPV